MSDRIGWVGETERAERFLQASGGTIWTEGAVPPGWQRKRSPAEACGDFTFVNSAAHGLANLLERGIINSAPAGSCVVLLAGTERHDEVRALGAKLDDAGLDALDAAFLDGRVVVGGDRDTFNLLKPRLSACGALFFGGPVGAATAARDAERKLLGMPAASRPDTLPALVEELEREGYFPQPIRNALKAGPLGAPDFDSAIDALIRRR